MSDKPEPVLDLNLIYEVLQSCATALPVLRNICAHAGLKAGARRATEMLEDVKKAIAEAERFAKLVRPE